MRNDAHDELDDIPSLTAERERGGPYPPPQLEPVLQPAESRSRQKRRSGGTAPLWVLVVALFIALGGLGWWSYQQISRLEMQLVATQDSFARISEDAAGRLQDISGKVVATESNVTTESEAVKLRIRQLEKQTLDLVEQQRALATQQQSFAGKQGNQDQRLGEQGQQLKSLASDLQNQQGSTAALSDSLEKLTGEQAASTAALKEMKGSLAGLDKLTARVEGLSKEIATLKQQGNSSQELRRLEQDVLVLRSELENRPRAQQGVNTSEFDSFRGQVTRTINAMQGQLSNLQQQINQN